MKGVTSFCLLAVLVVVGSGCGSAKAPAETSPRPPETEGLRHTDDETVPEPGSPTVHTVRAGETLSSIARRYGVSVNDVARANDLADPDRLEIGQPLAIPTASAAGTRTEASTGAWSWPVDGREILSGFGSNRGTGVHRGLDIRAHDGQPVVAAFAGVVVYSGADMRDYGRAVIIDHGGGLTSLYGHNSELLVATGDEVARGQAIARAGKSGNATTTHCHFEVRKNAVAIDPLRYLGGRN